MIKKYIILGIFVLIFLFYLFYIFGTTKITIQFEDLEPLKHHLPVYFKGFKLGHTTNVYPGKDFNSTMVDARIVLKSIRLPVNVSAILRHKDKKDYIELEYPDAPYIAQLSRNDIIEGHLGVNFEHYLQDQAENGGLEEIKDNVNRTIVSAGDTFDALTQMIEVLTVILSEAQPLIQDSMQNVNYASKNLADSSYEIKQALEKGYVDKALYNLQETSNNLVLTTKNTNSFTTNLNKESSLLFNCLLKNLNVVVSNVNQIVVGIGNTLKKKFGGLRLVFGGVNSCQQK